MHQLSEGLNIDPAIQVRVMENKIAQAAVREAQLETAVQQLLEQQSQLMHDKSHLEKQLDELNNPVETQTPGE